MFLQLVSIGIEAKDDETNANSCVHEWQLMKLALLLVAADWFHRSQSLSESATLVIDGDWLDGTRFDCR